MRGLKEIKRIIYKLLVRRLNLWQAGDVSGHAWSLPRRSLEEAKALVEGVARCGVGKWEKIKQLAYACLQQRSAVDLKDKWRNLLRVASLPPGSNPPGGAFAKGVSEDLLARVRQLPAKREMGTKSSRQATTTTMTTAVNGGEGNASGGGGGGGEVGARAGAGVKRPREEEEEFVIRSVFAKKNVDDEDLDENGEDRRRRCKAPLEKAKELQKRQLQLQLQFRDEKHRQQQEEEEEEKGLIAPPNTLVSAKKAPAATPYKSRIKAPAAPVTKKARTTKKSPPKKKRTKKVLRGATVEMHCTNCGCAPSSTPQMRHGPTGGTSLCNACGLYWRKHQSNRFLPGQEEELL